MQASMPAQKPTQGSTRHSISPGKHSVLQKSEADSVVYIPKHATPQKQKRSQIKPFTAFQLQQVKCDPVRLNLDSVEESKHFRDSEEETPGSFTHHERGSAEMAGAPVRHTAGTITMKNLEQQITLRYKRADSSQHAANRFNPISTHRGDTDNDPHTPKSAGS